jgi:hypothetical protein
MKKVFITIVVLIVVGVVIFGYIRYFVPFSDSGVKAGILNNVKHKGFIFKTYEGELIQSGFGQGMQGLQSNEFQFSVDDKELATKLMNMSGQNVKLHYKEYYGKLPWRGYSKYIVDSIISVDPVMPAPDAGVPPLVTQ